MTSPTTKKILNGGAVVILLGILMVIFMPVFGEVATIGQLLVSRI